MRVMEEAADLHVHTTHSDGVCSPAEVVRAAASMGMRGLAITDHDTVSALSIARPEAERHGIELIPAIELTCEHEKSELHALGYFLDATDAALTAALTRARAERDARLIEIADRLAEIGLSVDLAAIRATWPQAALGRRHVADWLLRTRQAESRQQVFAQYLGETSPAFVPRRRLSVESAFRLVREAGGVTALAHPPRRLGYRELLALKEMGLIALEVDAPRLPNNRARRLKDLARALELLPVAGSDFHAPDRPGGFVGRLSTPWPIVEQLRAHSSRSQRAAHCCMIAWDDRTGRPGADRQRLEALRGSPGAR